MEAKSIDIIVPVYNTERYLPRCIDSILSQTASDYNVILVDDGSCDNSGDICEKYSNECGNIYTYHTTNNGLSAARNYGIGVSKSKYVSFIDSDDWIENRMIEILLRDAESYDADISACNMYTAYSFSNKKCKNEVSVFGNEQSIIYREIEVLRNFYYKFSVCNKIFKRRLFDNISFPEGKIFEDARTMFLLANISNVATFNKYNGYNYYRRDNSITQNVSASYLYDKIMVWNEIAELVLSRIPEEQQYIAYRKNKAILEAIKYFENLDDPDGIKRKILLEIEPFIDNGFMSVEEREKLKLLIRQ